MENFEGPESSPNLLKKLQAENPDRNVSFIAIDQLKDEVQIREFFQQYVEMLRYPMNQDPEALARQNIGSILGYYDKETANRWMKALPGVSHPVLGKDIPRTDVKRAYEIEAVDVSSEEKG